MVFRGLERSRLGELFTIAEHETVGSKTDHAIHFIAGEGAGFTAGIATLRMVKLCGRAVFGGPTHWIYSSWRAEFDNE